MSKSSNRTRYIQLLEWLSTRPKVKGKGKKDFTNQSRLETYKERGLQ